MFSEFTFNNQWFTAMDSAQKHEFMFNEAVSFMVECETQDEIDYFWEKLSAVPAAEQCGWVKDQYGVSWQIIPANMGELIKGEDAAASTRKTQAMLKMKKLDIQALKNA